MKVIYVRRTTLEKVGEKLKRIPYGKPIRVTEHNKYFDWYKKNKYYRLVKETDEPCKRRRCNHERMEG